MINNKESWWKVTEFDLPNADKYYFDIESIYMADTELKDKQFTNYFFQESCQMLANSIKLFQLGYFDSAFYSLRQSIENSIGTLYLLANPHEMKSWNRLENGFESGKMANWLKEKEPIFQDIRAKLKHYLDSIFNEREKMNKYVHKQGLQSFYTYYRAMDNDTQKQKSFYKIKSDFEHALIKTIGAVAIYRLSVDPFPLLLNDEEVLYRSWDFWTIPFNDDFIKKYIGNDVIELYKTTNIYVDYRNSIMKQERQNDTIFKLIHCQIFNRTDFNEFMKQSALCSNNDKIVVSLFMMSNKISKVYNGFDIYTSDVKSNNDEIVGVNNKNEYFIGESNNYNIEYGNAYLSRWKVAEEYYYLEHNECLSSEEIFSINILVLNYNSTI
jgi:hypothetical protein